MDVCRELNPEMIATVPGHRVACHAVNPVARPGEERVSMAKPGQHDGAVSMTGDLLSLERVTKNYSSGGLLARSTFNAVDDVSFTLDASRPEIFAIIGESGSGKTTLARMILNMVSANAGTVRFRGKDLATIRGRRARLDFMRQIQPIFQNPYEAFNPLKRVDRYLYATARHLARVWPGRDGKRVRRGVAQGWLIAD